MLVSPTQNSGVEGEFCVAVEYRLEAHIPLETAFATQNHSRWVLALAWKPNTEILRYLYQHGQWNIGCVGFQTQNFGVGHEHFMVFVLISLAFGSQRKLSFQWNMGFRNFDSS